MRTILMNGLVEMIWKRIYLCSFLMLFFNSVSAYQHDQSKVEFLDYSPELLKEYADGEKPLFLLFSAEWCHWCKVLESKTLREEKVYQYLNRHFVNIFIDADIHNGIYLKYRATGVPYTVFLNPDQSVYFKYSGVLYAEDFLEVIRGVQENVAVGKSLYGDDEELEAYLPPKEFNLAKLESLHQLLNDGVLDNIDWKHAGLGQGQKTIHPQLSLYLLENSSVEDQEQHLEWIIPALEQAIRHLYDPLEGGFYRYAETREWEVAHFEKMADLNAGMVALLQKVNQLRPTPEFEKTAEQTLKYLVKTLYSEELGVFLSFQEADTFYYFLNAEGRSQGKTPEVIQRIFTDRLSRTLLQLMAIEGIPGSFQLDQKILSSLDFLASMVIREKQIYHFYDMKNGQWETSGGLEDLALLSVVFAEAAKKYRKPHYLHALKKLHQLARQKNYDRDLQIFSDHNLNPEDDLEFHLEMNAWLALSFIENPRATDQDEKIIRDIIRYFSAIGVRLEDHLWDSKDWYFSDRYVAYLTAFQKLKKR